MNSIHDLGGMSGFGPIPIEEDEPVFHHDWERRAFSINIGKGGDFGPIDEARHRYERLSPAFYLAAPYYERWIAGLELALKEHGAATEEELERGEALTDWKSPTAAPTAAMIEARSQRGSPATRDIGRQTPRFEIGAGVRARNIHPKGHTRLPRYVRGHVGTVVMRHGTHVFPDTNAHGQGENPQPLYTVEFEARELWGPQAPANDRVRIDLWEDYLEPAE